jgi:hypothetical protein
LATDSAGGSPVVLIADAENMNIRAWEMVKIFGREEGTTRTRCLELLWFGERSGAVLLRTHGCCLLWLDLHSKKIVRCFSSDRRMSYAQVYCPYEMDLSSWAPTFSCAVTI